MCPGRHSSMAALVSVLFVSSFVPPLRAQKFDNNEIQRDRAILRDAYDNVRKHYYDPKFHGVDWDARVAEAKQKIEHATSFDMAMSNIQRNPQYFRLMALNHGLGK